MERWGKTTTGILKYVYDQLNDDDIDMFEAMPIEMTLKYDGLPHLSIFHKHSFYVLSNILLYFRG